MYMMELHTSLRLCGYNHLIMTQVLIQFLLIMECEGVIEREGGRLNVYTFRWIYKSLYFICWEGRGDWCKCVSLTLCFGLRGYQTIRSQHSKINIVGNKIAYLPHSKDSWLLIVCHD